MSASSELQAEELLDNITTSVQRGDEIEAVVGSSGASHAGLDEYIDMIQALQSVLTPSDPRPEFVNQLRADLLDPQQGVVERMRLTPAQVQIAAILALIAGCLLFIRRRLFGSDSAPEIQEEVVATPL